MKSDGSFARVIEVPGAVSQGRSREEARVNLIDALRLMLSPETTPSESATDGANRSSSR